MATPYARKAKGTARTLAVLVISTALPLLAANPITVTVNSGACKTFQGFGHCLDEPTAGEVMTWPDSVRLDLARQCFVDADFRYLRCWAHEQGNTLQYFTDQIGTLTKPYVEEIRTIQPNLVILLGPTDRSHKSPQDHAAWYVEMIGKLRDEYQFRVDVTGVCNEPNVPGRFSPDETATLVNLFRQGLDNLGMQDVGIIAPEVSNVDGNGYNYGRTLKSQAWDKMVGFSTHSYGIAMTKDMMDIVGPDKDHWETESSGDFAHTPAHILSDINLGVTHWFAFYGYRSGGDCHGECLITYNPGSGSPPTMYGQFHAMIALAKLIRPGTVMRFCETNMSGEVNQYMELNRSKGPLPPICAAAGIGSDGAWVIGVSNQSGCAETGAYAWPAYPATTFDVTVDVQELENEGDLEFAMRVMTTENGAIAEEIPLTMTAGRLTIPDFVPRSLALVKAASDVSVRAQRSHYREDFLIRARSAPGAAFVTFGAECAARPQLALYNLDGRIVRTLIAAQEKQGGRTLRFDIRGVAPGAYVIGGDRSADGEIAGGARLCVF